MINAKKNQFKRNNKPTNKQIKIDHPLTSFGIDNTLDNILEERDDKMSA